MTSASLAMSTVYPNILWEIWRRTLHSGNVLAGSYQLTFPASVGAKGTTVTFTTRGTYRPNRFTGSTASPYPWTGSSSVVLP